jgi:hypothetical protein
MEDLQQQPEADYKINLSNPEVKESEESKEEVVSDSNENKGGCRRGFSRRSF